MITGEYWIYCSIFWCLFSLFLFIFVWPFLKANGENNLSITLLNLILVTLVMRVIPQVLLPVGAGFDIQSYEIVGNSVLNRVDVYTAEATRGRYPYLPLQMYWSAFIVLVSNKTSIPFPVLVKIASILGDLIIAISIYLIQKKQFNSKIAGQSGFLFAISPISIFVSAFHGQFDSLPIAMVIVSLYFASRPLISGLLFGFSILLKSWTVLFLPSVLRLHKNFKHLLVFIISIILPPIAAVIFYTLAFNSSITDVIRTALSYNHGIGVWGYSYFIKIFSLITGQSTIFYWFIQNGRFITLFILFLIWTKISYKKPLISNLFIIVLTFLSFTHAFSIQYLSWLIPFAILDRRVDKWLFRYTIASFSYMFLAYHTLILQMNITNILPWKIADHLIILAGIPAWLTCIGWLFNSLHSGTKNEI